MKCKLLAIFLFICCLSFICIGEDTPPMDSVKSHQTQKKNKDKEEEKAQAPDDQKEKKKEEEQTESETSSLDSKEEFRQAIERIKELATKGNEIYDLSDPTTKALYDDVVKNAPAGAISRDTSSWKEIVDTVKQHGNQDGVLILDGAYSHQVPALKDLTDSYNITYVPADGQQIKIGISDSLSSTGTVSEDDMRIQMQHDIGVVKSLGFDNMESFRNHLDSQPYDSSKPDLLVLSRSETGSHQLYVNPPYTDATSEFYNQAADQLSSLSTKPYIQTAFEDLNVKSTLQYLQNGTLDETIPRFNFMQKMYNQGFNVTPGAYGHLDRQQSPPGVK